MKYTMKVIIKLMLVIFL